MSEFEALRPHLRAIAHRMLGSYADADDALQATWLRLTRAAPGEVDDPRAFSTTVLSRVCLNMLRARRTRLDFAAREARLHALTEPADPEHTLVAAHEVSGALLVVLARLSPTERVAFVLHDLFAMPFEQVADVLGRTVDASKKLASRARVKVRGEPPANPVAHEAHRAVVTAFLHAARGGDIATLLTLLAPDVVRHADREALPEGVVTHLRGARDVADETRVFAAHAALAEVARVGGVPGLVVAPAGRLRLALCVRVQDARIVEIDVMARPERLASLAIAVL
ncbi:MAG: sigma-70 family RNA polymerase sigma factor [Polyangiales bacterium]